jgi:hypothetical protein
MDEEKLILEVKKYEELYNTDTGDKHYNREWEVRGSNYFVNGM